MSERRRNGLASRVARGLRQLLDEPLGYFGRWRKPMSVLEIPQGLLRLRALLPVRLDCIAELGQGGLGGHGQMRGITRGFAGQKRGDRIGRRRRARDGCRRPRRRQSRDRLRRRGFLFGADGLWSGSRGWRGSGGLRFRRRESKQRRRVALALQQKRVNGDADKRDRQGRSETSIASARSLRARRTFVSTSPESSVG